MCPQTQLQFLNDELERRQDLVRAVAALQNLAVATGMGSLENIPVVVHPEVDHCFTTHFADIAAAMYTITEPWQRRN